MEKSYKAVDMKVKRKAQIYLGAIININYSTEDIRTTLLLVCMTLISLFFHLYNLGYEFSNDETIVARTTVQFMHGFINPVFFGSIFIFEHPPIRVLVNVPFVLLFGTTEAVMRFPHALFGGMSTIIVYVIGRKAYGKKGALLSSGMYAVSGISAINRQNQGVGI